MWDDHAYLEPWHSQNCLFKCFQGYFGIFRDIDGNLATLSFVELGSKGEASPTLSENRKIFPDFGKKGPDYEVPFYQRVPAPPPPPPPSPLPLGIFRDVNGNSAPLSCIELGRKGEASPALFGNRKKFPDFGRKGPDYEVPLSKGPSSLPPPPPIPPIPTFAFCKTLHLKCLTVFIFSTLFFSGICWHR